MWGDRMTTMLAETFVPFAVAVYLLALAPGPTAMLVVRQAMAGGRRAALWTTAGNSVGLLAWSLAAAVGLAAVIAASQTAYVVLRLVGAAVLLVLGVRTLLAARGARPHPMTVVDGTDLRPSAGAAFRMGLLNNLANPKVAVFALSLLPQFAPANASAGTYVALAFEWALLAASWYVVLTLMVVRAGAVFRGVAFRRWSERLAGVTLVGLGVQIAVDPAR
jgi:threonine/homoserine/homoserine lactone efflux protein